MKMNRLFEIVYLLMEKRTMTARELAEHFEVSVRTIYRDVEVLSGAGIPLYANKGRGGGIGILENFVLNKSLLSEKEKNEILWALQGLDSVRALSGSKTLEKLKALFGGTAQSWIEVDFSEWGDAQQKLFEILREAITQRKVLEFDYYNSEGEKSRRRAEPLQLCFKSRSWYLKAYCRKKCGIRLFKLSRIQELRLLEDTFALVPESGGAEKGQAGREREKEGKIPEWENHLVTVKLEIDASETYRVYDEYREEDLKRLPGGGFVATLTCPENEWVYGYLLSYGDRARVLEPDHVREILARKLERMRGYYRADI